MTEPTRQDRRAVFDMFRGELAVDPDRYLAPALRWVETGEGYPPSIPAHVSLDCIAELIGNARGAGLFERVEPLATEIDRLRLEAVALIQERESLRREVTMLEIDGAKLEAELDRLRAELAESKAQLGTVKIIVDGNRYDNEVRAELFDLVREWGIE